MDLLDSLKGLGGPFTNEAEVKKYLEKEDHLFDNKAKLHRLKKKIQFARERSTTPPRLDPIFKIQITMPNKKQWDKTAIKFGESLMDFLGNKAGHRVR